MSVVFVMVIFFWEPTRGYAMTNIPGYASRELCEASAGELRAKPPPITFGTIHVVCIPGQ